MRAVARVAWVALAIGLGVLAWAVLVPYTDTQTVYSASIGGEPQAIREQTWDCPALREDALEVFWASEYVNERPCSEGRNSRATTAKWALFISLMSGIVIVSERIARRREPSTEPASDHSGAMA